MTSNLSINRPAFAADILTAAAECLNAGDVDNLHELRRIAHMNTVLLTNSDGSLRQANAVENGSLLSALDAMHDAARDQRELERRRDEAEAADQEATMKADHDERLERDAFAVTPDTDALTALLHFGTNDGEAGEILDIVSVTVPAATIGCMIEQLREAGEELVGR